MPNCAIKLQRKNSFYTLIIREIAVLTKVLPISQSFWREGVFEKSKNVITTFWHNICFSYVERVDELELKLNYKQIKTIRKWEKLSELT